MPASRVVIVGAGFAGLSCARALRGAPLGVTVIDRHNHHLFQPLLYQVATAALSPADIAAPIRTVLRHQKNTEVVLGEVRAIDLERRSVALDDRTILYDTLVLAAGMENAYFGHADWKPLTQGLKSVDEAINIRRRFLLAFERAESARTPVERQRLLTFVIVGGGPTGVELAGAMAEIARHAMPRDFRHIDTRSARVVLIEAVDRVLPSFPERCSKRARRDLEALGVEVRTNCAVSAIDAEGLVAGGERFETVNIIWAAGVQASGLTGFVPGEHDKGGRIKVEPDLTVPGHPEVFVLGDLAAVVDPKTGRPVPGVAPAAIQMGRYAGRVIARRADGRPVPPFRYRDKGLLATIGRGRAVAAIGRARFGGLAAWLLWALVHIYFLINFRNRAAVMLSWAWTYLLFERGARLITGERTGDL